MQELKTDFSKKKKPTNEKKEKVKGSESTIFYAIIRTFQHVALKDAGY